MSTAWRRVGAITFTVAALLLLSMGGAILAAPVTLPLMYLAARRHAVRPFLVLGAVLGGMTAAEVVWAATYVVAREAQPWIWLLPFAAALATAAVFGTAGRRLRVHLS